MQSRATTWNKQLPGSSALRANMCAGLLQQRLTCWKFTEDNVRGEGLWYRPPQLQPASYPAHENWCVVSSWTIKHQDNLVQTFFQREVSLLALITTPTSILVEEENNTASTLRIVVTAGSRDKCDKVEGVSRRLWMVGVLARCNKINSVYALICLARLFGCFLFSPFRTPFHASIDAPSQPTWSSRVC
jgi:hypothetical protein